MVARSHPHLTLTSSSQPSPHHQLLGQPDLRVLFQFPRYSSPQSPGSIVPSASTASIALQPQTHCQKWNHMFERGRLLMHSRMIVRVELKCQRLEILIDVCRVPEPRTDDRGSDSWLLPAITSNSSLRQSQDCKSTKQPEDWPVYLQHPACGHVGNGNAVLNCDFLACA